eukprot:365255-Chlamydomonas_euryale.AAC.16
MCALATRIAGFGAYFGSSAVSGDKQRCICLCGRADLRDALFRKIVCCPQSSLTGGVGPPFPARPSVQPPPPAKAHVCPVWRGRRYEGGGASVFVFLWHRRGWPSRTARDSRIVIV